MSKLIRNIFVLSILLKLANAVNLNKLKDDRVISWNFGSIIHPANKSVEFDIKFFAPTAPGQYPIIVFLTGLDGLAIGDFYTEFCTKLVISSNSIIVAFDGLKFIKFPVKEEQLFQKTLDWTLTNIYTLFDSDKTPAIIKGLVFPDLKTSGISLLGHSSGCHPVVSYLNNTCGLVTSLILLDPVDGYDPFGLIKQYITNPPKQLPFLTPTLVGATGLSSVSVGHLNPTSCAPTNISNMRFYESLSGPTFYMNFTSYGHADVLDSWLIPIAGHLVCKTCESNCDYSLYRTNIANSITYFLKTLKEKNPKYLNAIENPSSGMFDPNINIISTYKPNGYDVLKTGPFCIYNKDKSNN